MHVHACGDTGWPRSKVTRKTMTSKHFGSCEPSTGSGIAKPGALLWPLWKRLHEVPRSSSKSPPTSAWQYQARERRSEHLALIARHLLSPEITSTGPLRKADKRGRMTGRRSPAVSATRPLQSAKPSAAECPRPTPPSFRQCHPSPHAWC